MASESDRLYTFEDNLQRLTEFIGPASALADQAKSAFATANADFRRSVDEILRLLKPNAS